MINIKEKFEKEIREIFEAAKANQEEAVENTVKCEKELVQHRNHLTDLEEEVSVTKSRFPISCKELKKLSRSTEPDPDAVETAAEIFKYYVGISRQLPEARQNVSDATETLALARDEKVDAIKSVSHISYFL